MPHTLIVNCHVEMKYSGNTMIIVQFANGKTKYHIEKKNVIYCILQSCNILNYVFSVMEALMIPHLLLHFSFSLCFRSFYFTLEIPKAGNCSLSLEPFQTSCDFESINGIKCPSMGQPRGQKTVTIKLKSQIQSIVTPLLGVCSNSCTLPSLHNM